MALTNFFTDQTTDTEAGPSAVTAGSYAFVVQGTWDGATVTLTFNGYGSHKTPLDITDAGQARITRSQDGVQIVTVPSGNFYCELAGAGSATDLSAGFEAI